MLSIFSLRTKITLLMTVIILGITGSLTFILSKKEQNNHESQMKEKGALFLDTIDVMVRNPLYSLEVNTIIKEVKQFREHQTVIEAVCVFDEKGRLIIDSTKGRLELETKPDVFGQKIIKNNNIIYLWHTDYLLMAKPIIFGQKTVGAIAIKLSSQTLKNKLEEVRFQGLIIAFFASSGGIIIAVFMSYSLTYPLEQLIKATNRITQGDLAYRIRLKNKDEFSLLAREFNNMSEWLEKTLKKYEETNTKLQHDLFHDSLTGLVNRVFILREIEAEIDCKKQNPNYLFGVLFLDCDRFKIINDSLGHEVGDQVLIAIAKVQVILLLIIFSSYPLIS